MLNTKLHLNEKLFDKDVEKKATRQGYGEGLVMVGEKNKNIVALCADLAESTRTNLFRAKFPERFVEMGVAEQNLATVSAGMALAGKVPFMSSFAVFSPGRNWEQIRTTICYNDVNVKIASTHAGISAGPDGATHQCLEDIALMRTLPNMKVIVPCDYEEAIKATMAVADTQGPVYLRMSRPNSLLVTSEKTSFKIGVADYFWRTDKEKVDVTIIACGLMVGHAILAAKLAEVSKIKVAVINSATIKPLDTKTILNAAKYSKVIITAEEHQIAGGLGGAVAEYLSEVCPIKIVRIGVKDSFGESGEYDELFKKYGLDAAGILKVIKKAVS